MSTRSTTHFTDRHFDPPTAIIYRHSDGYPTGAGKDILEFLEDVRVNAQDPRFNDSAYLPAKYVVWLADKFAVRYSINPATGAYECTPAHPLDFISVGVMREDPGDIEYRYTVVCDGTPTVYCDALDGKGDVSIFQAIADYEANA